MHRFFLVKNWGVGVGRKRWNMGFGDRKPYLWASVTCMGKADMSPLANFSLNPHADGLLITYQCSFIFPPPHVGFIFTYRRITGPTSIKSAAVFSAKLHWRLYTRPNRVSHNIWAKPQTPFSFTLIKCIYIYLQVSLVTQKQSFLRLSHEVTWLNVHVFKYALVLTYNYLQLGFFFFFFLSSFSFLSQTSPIYVSS